MDQNSKENSVDADGGSVPETESVPSEAEKEAVLGDFSLEASESGEQPSSAPVQTDQAVDDSQTVPQEYTEEEIQQQVGEIAHLPEEDKLTHLKNVAQNNSLEKAIRLVKRMNDPWLEDKFHDDLMDDPEWRRKLEELGKIERL